MNEQTQPEQSDIEKRAVIFSRVTILDRQTLYVTESQDDFASTVLEDVVQEHVPGYTHNPPTVILLEGAINKDRETDLPPWEPTPLALAVMRLVRDDAYGSSS